MGQKDHVEAGADHIFDLGLDLEYLHVAGADRQAGGADGPPAMEEQGESASNSSTAKSPPLAVVDSGRSDAGCEPVASSTSTITAGPYPDGGEGGSVHSKNTHQLLCRTQCVDLGTEGPPELPSEISSELEHDTPAQSPASSPCRHLAEPPSVPSTLEPTPKAGEKDYQTKLEFALKLGYSEETVRLVLFKLGPDTLINDILGELVKLGTKSDSDQPAGSLASTSSSSSSSSSCGCSDLMDGQRSDSPGPSDSLSDQDNLRPIVVDGSNVAMSHGNKEVFSCQGIQLAVDWFLERGHHNITVFVPAWRKEQSRPDAPITDQEILRRLEKEKILVFTPSRRVQGRRVVCYDDRFIVKLAYESDGIIVSNDNYRDLANEKPEWKKFIDERLLMYSFVNDKFMPPDDPLGRHGPSLDNFLRKKPVMPEQKKQPCPYGKKCTYGHKCKYYHPERSAQPQRAVADELRASAKTCVTAKNQGDSGLVKSHSVPAGSIEAKKGAPKRQSDPSIRALSYSDAEEKLLSKGRVESQKNSLCGGSSISSSSSSNSGSGSITMSPAPGGPPSGLSLPQDQQSRAATPHGLLPAPSHDLYPHCESPDVSYYSVTRAYSGLSLSSRRSPDCRFPNDTDLRLGSMGSAGSECGSESNVSCSSSCDSYSERPCPSCPGETLLEDSIHFANPHSCLYPHHAASNHELCGLHPADYTNIQHSHTSNTSVHSYHLNVTCGQSCSHDQPPAEASLKRPLYPLPPHLQHQPLATRSSCPGDYHSLPQSNSHPPGSPLGHCLAPTRTESVSDSHLYEHLSTSRHQLRPKALPSWDTYYRQPPMPPSRYESSSYQGLPESSWHTPPWAQDSYTPHHSSHLALHASQTHYLNHPPPLAHSRHPPHPSSAPLLPYSSHLPVPTHAPPSYVPQHPESPAHSRYGDAREKVYVNLCNIFPSELVSRVMARSPHITDPQELAAAILAEKAQTGY